MTARIVCFLSIFIVIRSPALAGVDRIDPPNWWVGMEENAVQLMLYGRGIGGSNVTSQSPDVIVTEVVSGDSANYLFVTLEINESANPQTAKLEFISSDGERDTINYLLKRRREGSADRRGFAAKDAVYLVMPDRFANGDPSNDEVEQLYEGLDREDPYGRHGGDLAGIIAHVDYLTSLGMTQLWMTPVLENNQPESSYHGYAITDLYRVDARLGSNEDYVRLSEVARKKRHWVDL